MSLTIKGLIIAILSIFIDNTELVGSLANDIVLVVGILVAWYGRYRQGDIDITGLKK